MWYIIWPILIVILANTFYNISAKATPQTVNAFASLAVTYLVASILSLVLYYTTGTHKNIMIEFGKMNWTSGVLAIAIVALEFGYISIYRAGWNISIASLIANIGLASVLVVIGTTLYQESLSARQIAGIVVCVVGLLLIKK